MICLERGAVVKLYHHIVIISILAILTYFLYGDGFGIIPFILTTIYLAYITYKEVKEWKNQK